MESVVGIRLRKTARVAEFPMGGLEIARGEYVVVETEKGIVVGQMMYGPLERAEVPPNVKPVIRKADIEDLSIMERNRRKEEDAYLFCSDRIDERGLPMKLVDVEYILSGGKAIFYFTADGRVDFRALVKDLAQQFHIRIEMRQIGVRDESKMLGGVGPCGRELCCSSFLKAFEPVSIRMAKDQNLALNPQKVSGLCGRLMCCLCYEQSTYDEIWGQIPKIGKRVLTPKGEGKVMSVDIKNQKVRTLIGDDAVMFTIEEIRELNKDMVRPPDRSRQGGQGRDGGGQRRDGGDRRDRGPRHQPRQGQDSLQPRQEGPQAPRPPQAPLQQTATEQQAAAPSVQEKREAPAPAPAGDGNKTGNN
jgi:cell fate regulator YaaT (PSP1 superfamily)